ncbi:hypothetical protein [Cellulosilyticum sp. I15G10I2]|uniref:hypothetical protein n=1 Tax=Cellulosilyticum sp. I15G10I2 TaxID=1892843 RepID=UPI00085CD524|nr:hypothetical protein [Cellulosilyticum sp. I15G10I2]
MIDQDKIILMTKLAIYEKKYIKEDRRRNSYYLEDYIYVNNFKTRISVTIAAMLFAILDIMKNINHNVVFPDSIMSFIKLYISPYLMPWLIVLIIYTMISTAVYGNRYALSQKRLRGYDDLLKQLDAYEQDKANEERACHETE